MSPWVVSLLLLGVGVLLWRFFSNRGPAGAVVEIRIRSGKCRLSSGSLRPGMLTDVAELVSEARVATGSVWVAKDRRVHFSSSIPAEFHQRLRNVLLNS